MVKEKEITSTEEGTQTEPTPGPGDVSGGDDKGDIDLMSLSCGELGNLAGIIAGQIVSLQNRLEDTPKVKFLQRRKIQIQIDPLWELRSAIQGAMIAKGCRG
jgi:hypothetical protein